MLRLVITLPLRNQDALDQFLEDVYDPNSASYRQFLTVEEFTAQFGPTQENYDAVIEFAQANGLAVVGTSRNRLFRPAQSWRSAVIGCTRVARTAGRNAASTVTPSSSRDASEIVSGS